MTGTKASRTGTKIGALGVAIAMAMGTLAPVSARASDACPDPTTRDGLLCYIGMLDGASSVSVDIVDLGAQLVDPAGLVDVVRQLELRADAANVTPVQDRDLLSPGEREALVEDMLSPEELVADMLGPGPVVESWKDKADWTVRLRSTPRDKIQSKHDLPSRSVRAATKYYYEKQKEASQGTTYRYYTWAVKYSCSWWSCKETGRVRIKTVVDFRVLKDGYFYGVVTAFCEGYSGKCPSWVKEHVN